MKRKSSYLTLFFALFLLVSCGATNSEPEKESHTSTSPRIELKEYFDNKCCLQNIEEAASLLLHPCKEAINKYGNYKKISNINSSFVDTRFVLNFPNQVSYGLDTTYWGDFDNSGWNYFSDRDLLETVVYEEKGFEVLEGIRIGDSVSKILSNTNLNINTNDNYFILDCTFGKDDQYLFNLDFEDKILSSAIITYYQGSYPLESEEERNSDHSFSVIQQAFSYLDSIGEHYDISQMIYYGKKYDYTRDAWFYIWTFGPVDGPTYFRNIRVEVGGLHRIIDFGGNVFWRNGKFVTPWMDFVGTYYSGEDTITFNKISYNGEFECDLILNGISYKGVNGIFGTPEKGDISNLFGCPYASRLEYQNELGGSGYFTYNKSNNPVTDRLCIDPFENVVILARNLNNSQCFLRQTMVNTIGDVDFSTGYMEHFGRDDLDLDSSIIVCDPNSESDNGRYALNQYMNKNEKTEGLDYTSHYLTYKYDYYYAPTNTIYYVWEFYKDGKYFYVDSKNDTIIMEQYKNGPFRPAIKKAVWSKNDVIKDYFVAFGDWTGTNKNGKEININIDFEGHDLFSTITYNGFLGSMNNVEINLVDMWTEDWSKVFYFAYQYGPYSFCGFYLINLETWELTLHVTRSNLPDFDMGIITLHNSENWTYAKNIPDWTEEEIEKKEQETESPVTVDTMVIKDFYGKILGKIEIKSNGDQIGYNFYGQIVGYYYIETNKTIDFYGRIISTGNTLASLIV